MIRQLRSKAAMAAFFTACRQNAAAHNGMLDARGEAVKNPN